MQNTNNPLMIIVPHSLPIKGRFYHRSPYDENYFLITFKIVQENPGYFLNDNDPDDGLYYDHEFFYEYHTVDYHIRCKFIPHTMILDLLNCEYDINTLHTQNKPLSLQQRLNLEKSLGLELYLRISKETIFTH